MKIVGLTGGIGSGKSTVAKMFSDLGVAIYIADDEAKKIMQKDPEIKQKIQDLLGMESYKDSKLNTTFVASKVFKDRGLLAKLNAIVHPSVGKDFNAWKNKQSGPYVIKEAAILFENEGYKSCDKTILVIASKKSRLQRILNRDNSTREEILARMANQWPDRRKIVLTDLVINNNDNMDVTRLQVIEIHQKLLKIFHYTK